VTEQEHEQREEETPEEREETIEDLDVPETAGEDVKGGLTVRKAGDKPLE
jgi:hypothetical protein